MEWRVLVGAVSGLLVLWVALVVTLLWLARRHGDPATLRGVLRLAPDTLRLVRRLASDPALPRGVRVRMALLAAYLLSPVDLVPDFLPVVGYADDALLVLWALRSVVRRAGPAALERHWPGTPEGLRAVRRFAGVPG